MREPVGWAERGLGEVDWSGTLRVGAEEEGGMPLPLLWNGEVDGGGAPVGPDSGTLKSIDCGRKAVF